VVANASATHNYLYINDGDGNFTLAANSLVTKEKGDSHGTCFGDFDNDGWLDLIITNDAKTETYFYLNDGQGDFVRNTNQIFDQVMGKSFGVASTDFDLDGDLDIYIANHSNQANYFYTNTNTTYNWVGFLLTGTKSNRDAIGAKVKIKAQINGEPIWQIREIRSQSGGMGSQNSNKAHFGLHQANKVDSLVVEWPSGLNQVYKNVKINKYYQVEEGNSKLRTRLGNKLYKDCEKSSLRKAAKQPDCKVKLYPQPATDWLYVKHEDTFDLYFYNQSGKLLTQQKSNFNEASVYLKNYPVGMYVVNIHSSCGIITKRVIKIDT